ncbi:PAS domain S-box protein [Sabulibacter ruber]|uniref:PAS domain S-box protein n=1 Tax=Sabulibacter ruber TaxID=2811901 RepID=UPI001A974F09|nr:PAS domain S-box protein [Sabulibacter ruber]
MLHHIDDYRLLFDHNPLPMWVFDTESLRFLMVNSSALKLYGYSREEFLQMTIKDIRPGSELPGLLRMTSSMRDDLNYAGEWMHLKKDKTPIYVEIVSHLLPSSEESDRRLVVVHDITARKLAEQQLAEVERYAQSILNNIVEVVFSFNEKMEVIYMSPQCEAIVGFKPKDFYQDKYLWFNLVHPEDRAYFEKTLPKIKVSSEQFQIEYRIKTSAGEEKWLITRCTAQLDSLGKMVRIDGSANDITQRKKVEEKLRFANFSIERASEAFLWTRPDGRIIRVNRAACSMLGYSEKELLQLKLADLVQGYAEDAWQSHWGQLEALKSLEFETSVLTKKGQVQPVELHLNYFRFEHHSYSFTSIRQIAERKQAEAEKARLTEEMAKQNEHLRQFAYIVSHNLKAPVANILGLTSLYNRQDAADPVNALLMPKLERTIHLLDSTINDLNDILTVKSKAALELESVNLEQVFSDVKESVVGQLRKHSVKIAADFTSGATVLGVKGYIHSIFLNLMTNAIKYQSPGRNLEIHINTVFSNGFLCFQIQDNGLGIDLRKQGSKIFGLYRRFHPQIEGKGLGLYMIKTQAETMGGWVDVESEVEKGSTFKVFFQVPPKND